MIYILVHTVSQSNRRDSGGQEVQRAVSECRKEDQVAPVENLSSKKQGRKSLNMNSQRGLRKGCYCSLLPVSGQVLCLCLSCSYYFNLDLKFSLYDVSAMRIIEFSAWTEEIMLKSICVKINAFIVNIQPWTVSINKEEE